MPAHTPPAGWVLAFDTSTEHMAVALVGPGVRLADNLPGGAAASATLLPAVHRLLGTVGVALQQVSAIAFGQGPGAFTGLRTSCAVAQGLAFGLGCPVWPVDSLLIVAEQARRQAASGLSAVFDVGVVMDARMGEAYAARYCHGPQGWQVQMSPGLWSPEALNREWAAAPPAACTGSGLLPFAAVLAQACPPDRHQPEGADRAGALLALAEHAVAAQPGVPADQALPLYLRDKVAQTTAEREAVRAAAAAAAAAA